MLTVSSPDAAAGGYGELTFRVPNEKDTAKTTSLKVQLPKDTPLAFHCHHGGRSNNAAEHFLAQGFKQVYNLKGGIDAWSVDVDPTVPRY